MAKAPLSAERAADHAAVEALSREFRPALVRYFERRGVPAMDAEELIDLDRALDQLAAAEPRLSRLIELRFFGGLKIEEVSAVLGCSPRTAKRDWTFARAWLLHRLKAGA